MPVRASRYCASRITYTAIAALLNALRRDSFEFAHRRLHNVSGARRNEEREREERTRGDIHIAQDVHAITRVAR